MTAAALANIITIHDKLIRLISEANSTEYRPDAGASLQGSGPRSLGWHDEKLQDFLERIIPAKFGVKVERKHLKLTMNGSAPTVGDLSIAIFSVVYKQQKPKAHFSI